MATEELADTAAPMVSPRYPDSCRLATMIACGLPVEAELAGIAQILARIHAAAAHGRHISSQASASNLSARWQKQLSELKRVAGRAVAPEVIDRVKSLANQYIEGRVVLFTQRIIDGHIIEGHGDLLADDIFCMPDGPVLLDFLESGDLLRYVDRIDDAACLAMDLEFLGRRDLADHFLDCYRRDGGDQGPASLTDFYIAYHAVVQANADCVRFSQGMPDAASDASRHLSLANEHLTAGTVHLTLIGGPGSRKTALARSLAERVGADVISIDDVQHELEQSNSIACENDIRGDGWCAAHSAAAVHDIAMRRAHTRLANGQSVILDSAWSDPRQRRLAKHLTTETRSTLLEILCTDTPPLATEPSGGNGGDEWAEAHRVDASHGFPESTDELEKLWFTLFN
jgi:aminoglycoside phosphotransferase family enzyme/predicted kinase